MTKTVRQDMFVKDRWLSQVMKNEAYALRALDGDPTEPHELEERFQNLNNVPREKALFVYAKIPCNQPDQTAILEGLGFRLVDTNVTFLKEKNALLDLPGTPAIRNAKPEDESETVRVAQTSFKYSRFHTDPQIDRVLADTVKAEWVRNYFLGKRGDGMIVADIGGRISGFLQYLKTDGTLVIDQIAVHADKRGIGIASAMIAFAETQDEQIKTMVVGTQIANVPSVRLYEKLGFRLVTSKYVFHYHKS